MEVWCPEDFYKVLASCGVEDIPSPPLAEEPLDTLGLKDDEGAIDAPKAVDAFPSMPNRGPKLDITVPRMSGW